MHTENTKGTPSKEIIVACIIHSVLGLNEKEVKIGNMMYTLNELRVTLDCCTQDNNHGGYLADPLTRSSGRRTRSFPTVEALEREPAPVERTENPLGRITVDKETESLQFPNVR